MIGFDGCRFDGEASADGASTLLAPDLFWNAERPSAGGGARGVEWAFWFDLEKGLDCLRFADLAATDFPAS